MSTFLEKTKSVILYGLVIFTFFVPVIPLYALELYNNTQITCETSVIPFETEIVDDDTITSDDTHTKINGSVGEYQVCKNGNSVETSKGTTLLPVNEVVIRGTYVEPVVYEEPVYTEEYNSGGSVCNDGVWTPATGRGTCSWHGGVAYTL
jgi:hypothetical protein